MIIIALGSNRAGRWGLPGATLARAVQCLQAHGVRIIARSPLLRSAPLGPRNQPEYVNAVIAVETALLPVPLLTLLHAIEDKAGRRRARRWGARELDLDLLAYHRCVIGWPHGQRPRIDPAAPRRAGLVLPHAGLDMRAFVVAPLAAMAPQWHHPVTGETAAQMALRLHIPRQGYVRGGVQGSVLGAACQPGWT